MPFHMYYNAFKNNKTIFSGRFQNMPRNDSDDGLFGWIEVKKVVDHNGHDLTNQLKYIQPDIDNKDDHTVLEVTLKNPILPYDSIHLDMEWHSKIPRFAPRTGYNMDFFFMAQWYPKLGVYEAAGSRFAKKGQWNCHQYHPQTEYFGEFGVYEVSIDLPSSFKTGASGFLIEEKINRDRKTVTYLAEDVIDFAWTAHEHFNEFIEEWKGIEIKLLLVPEHECNKDRFLESAKTTLSFYEDYLEKYPYPSLTIVSPPYHGLFCGAMEYPMLITSITLCYLPESIKTTETLTIHELTHQYFMQMVATNEQEEPWLDEGFTSFFESKILDKYYPEGVVNFNALDFTIKSTELRRGRFMSTRNPKINPLSDYGYHFVNGSTGDIFYGKAAVGLMTLEGLVGEEIMKEIMRTYFARWKFKHPCRTDFMDIVDEVVNNRKGKAFSTLVNAFLYQFIHSTEVCDYQVKSINNNIIAEKAGFFDSTDDCITPNETAPNKYAAKALVFRNGELIVPQEIKIIFENGDEVLEFWDGKERSKEFVYEGNRKIECVIIDPSSKSLIDNNVINNSLTTKEEKTGINRYFSSFITWMENILVSATSFI